MAEQPTQQKTGTIGFKERQAMKKGIVPVPAAVLPNGDKAAENQDDPFAPKPPPGGQENMFWKIKDGQLVRRQPGEITDFIRAADKELKVQQDAKKTAPQDKDKPLWSKWHEAVAKKQAENGGVIPHGWISSASKNEGGNPAMIPKGAEQDYRTNFGETATKQRSGLSSDDEWAKLFPKTDGEMDGTPSGRGRVNAAGVYQERGMEKDGKMTGNWVDMSRPLGSGDMLNDHFGGKWSAAAPEQRASMIRGELGLPPVGQWWTPDQAAQDVADGIPAASGLPSNTLRTASKDGKIVGFATAGPALPAATPFAPVANGNMRLPGVEPLFPDVMPGQLPKPIIPES